jgi:uncharacterized protein (DUF885 family)
MSRAITYAARAVLVLFLFDAGARGQDFRSKEASNKLHELFAAEWDYAIEQYPTWASSLGDRRWNHRWTDVSLEAISRRHNHHIELLAKLAKIDRAALAPEDQLNYDLFKKNYEIEVEGFQYHWHLLPMSQLDGVHTVNQLANALRFETFKDYEDLARAVKVSSRSHRPAAGSVGRKDGCVDGQTETIRKQKVMARMDAAIALCRFPRPHHGSRPETV